MSIRDEKAFYKKLASIVIPVAFQQFMLASVSAADAIMLGKLSQNSMAAVSLAGQVQFIFNLFLAGSSIGTSMLVAQYIGKGDHDAVERILGIVLRVTIPIATTFTLAALLIPQVIMGIFTSDADLVVFGAQYLRCVSLSYFFCGITQIYLVIMKNSGHALKNSLISSSSVVINICLNAIFIFGLFGCPAMGIAGAALSTVIARFVEMTLALSDMRKEGRIKIRPEYFIHRDMGLRKDFWKYATPAFLNQILWGLAFSSESVIMGHMNPDAVAANSIALIVKNLTACFCLGFGNGAGIILGNTLGSGDLERGKRYGDRFIKIAVLNGLVTGGFVLLISPIIVRFANLTPQASHYLRWMLVMCSYYQFGKSLTCTTNGGVFPSGGDSKFTFKCDTITMWGFIVPVGFLVAFVFKLPVLVIYFFMTLDETIKLPAIFIHYRKYGWVRNITKERSA